MKVQLVDPAAYTPAYDHALASALAEQGADVELATSPFPYGDVATPANYERVERFYKGLRGSAGSRRLRASRALNHLPDMLSWRRSTAQFDVAHLQWTPFQTLDARLMPHDRPLVMTAHDVIPREPRRGQVRAQTRLWREADCVVVHTDHGRRRLIDAAGVDPARVEVIPHGPFDHLAAIKDTLSLPDELADGDGPVVLMFGLLRPYKGLEVLLDAWRNVEGARLWIVGRPRYDITELIERAPKSVSFVTRYVDDREIPSIFAAADICVLPYLEIDQSGVLATALAFGTPMLLSDAGGFPEVVAKGAAAGVPAGDSDALARELSRLLADQDERARLASAARTLAQVEWSWENVARRHLEVYSAVVSSHQKRRGRVA